MHQVCQYLRGYNVSDHLKVSGDRTNPPIQHPPFIQNGHVTHGRCTANDVTSDITMLHHEKGMMYGIHDAC